MIMGIDAVGRRGALDRFDKQLIYDTILDVPISRKQVGNVLSHTTISKWQVYKYVDTLFASGKILKHSTLKDGRTKTYTRADLYDLDGVIEFVHTKSHPKPRKKKPPTVIEELFEPSRPKVIRS